MIQFNAGIEFNIVDLRAEDSTELTFVESADWEFVGGGQAVNNL